METRALTLPGVCCRVDGKTHLGDGQTAARAVPLR